MPANSFVRRRLRATFTLLGSGAVFPGTNSNVLTVNGLRMQAVVQATARLAAQMTLRVFGMRREDMEAITVAWANPPIILDHTVLLEADGGEGFSKVFSGTIIEAQPEYSAQPDTFLSLAASCGYFQKIQPTEPTPYTETVDIGLVAGDLAARMRNSAGEPFAFVNGGANGILGGPLYLHGTLVDQLDTACQMAGCDYYIANDTVTITPRGQPIEGVAPAVRLTKDTGMIQSPVYGARGLNVQALYQPAFDNGVPIDIESIVPNATGRWYPYSMTHSLDQLVPGGGKWHTSMQCLRVFV
jgi:hypothetical protein